MQKLARARVSWSKWRPLGTTRMRIEFRIPARGLFGYRSEFLTDTHGEGILNTIFDGYDEWRGELPGRSTGSPCEPRDGHGSNLRPVQCAAARHADCKSGR